MNTSSAAIYDRDQKPREAELSTSVHGAVVFGAVSVLVMYATIFAAALLTLSLVEIRQANMVNFNALIAALEQRDRELDKESGLATVLQRLGDQRKQYDYLIAHSPGCFRVAGNILEDEKNNQ
jgi:hypothetical protein